MRVLLLNQTFYPDVMATGQYLAELAVGLAERGHQVTVVASDRAYDNPQVRFARREQWRGVAIYRIGSTGFGKGAKWRRAADFASFITLCAWRLARLPKQDVVVALTSPPLISFVGVWLARLRGSRFYYWVMDFNPDEAIAAGWLRAGSWPALLLDWMSKFSLRHATRIIALDRFMRDRILGKGIPAEHIAVIPPWSHDEAVRFDAAGRERFRQAHRLEGKFVVMYSGNHSPCHPLDTLLEAARRLKTEPEIHFCFVGGGSEFSRVQEFARRHELPNVLCLPYQPMAQLAGSLSAADLHVVVMGLPFVGLVHPCKVYNILAVQAPILYIGPEPSHVTDLFEAMGDSSRCAKAAPGEVEKVLGHIHRICRSSGGGFAANRPTGRSASLPASGACSKKTLLPRLLAELETGGLKAGQGG